MSSAEFVVPSAVFSAAFPAMVAGTAATAAQANFRPGVSQVCGVQRVTSAGVPGAVSLQIGAVAIGAAGPVLTLNSASATDTSTYVVFWRNETSNSLLSC
jgi:hypothetical protein